MDQTYCIQLTKQLSIKQAIPMDNNNNSSLLGFLQKKSLFSNSPNNRTRNRSRSGSKDGRYYGNKSNVYQLDDRSEAPSERSGNLKFNYNQDNYRNYDRNQNRGSPNTQENNMFRTYQNNNDNHRRFEPFSGENKMYQPNTPNLDFRADPRQYQSTPGSDFRGVQATSPISELRNDLNQQPRYFKASEARTDRFHEPNFSNPPRLLQNQMLQNQIWSGLVAHTHSFESARIQSIQCLQSLSNKLAGEISNINFKIDSFNSKMGKVLSNQFRAMRDKIMQIFDAVFKESEKFIKDYMRQQENKLAGELIKVRDTLQKEQAKIEVMKEELKKPNWRKTAGQILTTELEKRVEETIRQSNQLNIGNWQLGDLGGHHIRNIQSQLRELVRLKPIR